MAASKVRPTSDAVLYAATEADRPAWIDRGGSVGPIDAGEIGPGQIV